MIRELRSALVTTVRSLYELSDAWLWLKITCINQNRLTYGDVTSDINNVTLSTLEQVQRIQETAKRLSDDSARWTPRRST